MKKELNFEESLKTLSEINMKLESDEVSLEEALKFFKEGVELSKLCQKKLDDAKQEIEQLTKS